MDLRVKVVDQQEKSVVYLSGEIDVYTAPKLKKAILPLTEQVNHLIEINFEHVQYMDSTGLGVFISALKSTQKYKSHLKLKHLNERILRLFNITGLNEIIDIE